MPAVRDTAHTQDVQLGMVNPPRKAKRLRELVSRESTGDPSVSATSLYYGPSSPTSRPTSPPLAAAPRRRGRKPAGPMSRTAREQLRKTNHSVIEKRRREKINDALAALRELVPNENHEGERKKEEKEFKLEVLVRTVEYLRMMVDRVKKLEAGRCEKCEGSLAGVIPSRSLPNERVAGKRKRTESEDEAMDEEFSSEDEELDRAFLPPTPDLPAPTPVLDKPASPFHPRLPSISTWMPHSPLDSPNTNSHAFQLLSPPQSAPFAPTQTSTGFLPGLALPSPIGPSPTGFNVQPHRGSPSFANASPIFASLGPRDRDVPELPLDTASHKRTAPTVSQGSSTSKQQPTLVIGVETRAGGSPTSPWTRDDQTVASLLLNMSSCRSVAASEDTEDNERGRGALEAQTPSSVLGMGDGRQGL